MPVYVHVENQFEVTNFQSSCSFSYVRLIQIVSYQVYNNFMYINETRHEDAREQNLS